MRNFWNLFHWRDDTRGFTLVELIVVMSILAMASSIVIFNYQGSRRQSELISLSYDISALFREAALIGRSSTSDTAYGEIGQFGPHNISNYDTLTGAGVEMVVDSVSPHKITLMRLYREKDNAHGYLAGTDVLLEEVSLSTSLPTNMLARLCSSTGTFDFVTPTACAPYQNSSAPVQIVYRRFQFEPEAKPLGYTGTLVGPYVIQVELDTGGIKSFRHIVIERTGNIFIR